LLAPTFTIYGPDQTTVLGSASGAGQYGTTISATVTGIAAGEQVYIKVAGAETTTLGSGKYFLSLTLGTASLPALALPNTRTLNASALSSGGGQAEIPGKEQGPGGGVGDVFDPFEKPDAPAGTTTSPNRPTIAVNQLAATNSQAQNSLAPQAVFQLVGAAKDQATVSIPVPFRGTIAQAMPASSVPPSPTQAVVHTETGTGGSSMPFDSLPGSEEQATPPAAQPVLAPAILDGAPAAITAAPEGQADLGKWLQACDACFAGHGLLPASETELRNPVLAEGGDAGAQIPSFALAALALGLGGSWALPRGAVLEPRFVSRQARAF
jgi:hypothetical protein